LGPLLRRRHRLRRQQVGRAAGAHPHPGPRGRGCGGETEILCLLGELVDARGRSSGGRGSAGRSRLGVLLRRQGCTGGGLSERRRVAGWVDLIRSLGGSLIEVLKAEVEALKEELAVSGRHLALGAALAGGAAVLLFWTVGALIFTLVAVL